MVSHSISVFQEDAHSPVPLNAFLEMYDDALERAREADRERAAAQKAGTLAALLQEKPLLGLPFAVKDNMSVQGKRLTCASHILEGYIAPYNATVIDRLVKAGAVPLGRCNMDEFAMGSSTEYSIYGPTRNPIDRAYVSGGSSGGGAAAVAANQALFALGTETGGSVRLPASYCGIYGLKPTYGVLSRWGIVAYGSSLDQVGVMGRTPRDIALPLSVMCGADFYDDTSADLPGADSLRNLQAFAKSDSAAFGGLKIAVPRQFLEAQGLSEDVRAVFDTTQKWFRDRGARVEQVDLPILNASLASYYVIALSEAASNLSRFDGIRYGHRVDPGEGYDELYVATRSEGFGAEVKRRIIIGNYVLSEQFSGDCYKKGMTVRARIQREIAALFQTHQVILCPTCPTAAFKLGQKVDDPLEMYLSDLYTMFVNLARIPSVSVPAGYTKPAGTEKAASPPALPVGIQFAGAMFSEPFILALAQAWEEDHPGCGIPVKDGTI
ncbi:MAG: Asp-tRNA(Asn)/Glu-tRNA(Gln) amidotransferase subunit GatA [Spirochaetaceae bacterium]|nr:Asp-tRNA(Asn)/Glu-tRNA(Gln) amidotransferase subunit GatA [Spirochaetaceae bacterium]